MSIHADTESQAPGVGVWLLRNAALMMAGVYPVLLALYWVAIGGMIDGGRPRVPPFNGMLLAYAVLFPALACLAILYVPLAMVIGNRMGRFAVIAIGIVLPAGAAATFAGNMVAWLAAFTFAAVGLTAMGSVVTLSAGEPLGWRRWLLAALPVLIVLASVQWVAARW